MIRPPIEPPKAKVPPDHPLFEIVEAAYRVFDCPKPARTEVCVSCCMDPKIEAAFFTPAIADMPLPYIQDWFSAACDPSGIAKETWGYLLPRILELLAADDGGSYLTTEVALSRYDTGNPEKWTAEEWTVLDRFQRRYLSYQIDGSKQHLDAALCCLGRGGWPLAELFVQILEHDPAKLAQRLWNDWCHGRALGREGIWITSFWDDADQPAMLQFYTSRDLYDRVERVALADESGSDLAAKASAVAAIIEWNADWSLYPAPDSRS